jgi:mannose-6-phosphate isomerase-like protein (cupin superfamily)
MTIYPVGPNQIVFIPDGAFHQVINTEEDEDLYFVCVFDGKRYG